MKKNLLKLAVCMTLSASAFAGAGNHHAALFLGGTAVPDSKSYFTVGVDYVYKTGLMDNKLSAGVFAEGFRATGYDVFIAGIPFVYQIDHAKVVVGFGVENKKSNNYGLVRLGTGYDFHFGNYSISPVLNFDYVKEKTAVNYGVTFGIGF